MDTNKVSSVADVPTFRIARVGKDRKRKGGGFSFLRGGGARGVWSGAAGGSGSGAAVNALGMSFAKVTLTIMLTAGIGSAAVYMGARSAASARSSGAKKPAVFSDKGDVKIEGDTSNLPSNANTIPNSLGYLAGSWDGLTPEERAKRAAAAAEAAEAQRKADEEAAKKAEADAAAAGKAADPAALLAAAQADGGKKGAFANKFGSLSSSLGGGSSLSGGAGMAGGVGRQFGSAGSLTKGAGGKLSANKAQSRTSSARAGNSRLAASRTKGFARRQLANVNAYSRRAPTAGTTETAAYSAGTAFENSTDPGNVISGPGIGTGSNGTGDTDTTPNAVGTGGDSGGAVDSTPVDCGADKYQDADGNCVDIKVDGGEDADPWLTQMADAVMYCLLAIGILSAVALAAKYTAWGWGVYMALCISIAALAAAVTGLGIAIMAKGDYVTGGIATAIGLYVSYMVWISQGGMTAGQGMVVGFGGAALRLAAKMLEDQKDEAPEAAQQ